MGDEASIDRRRRDRAIDLAVEELLAALDRGGPADVEAFCRDRPSMLPELRERIAAALFARSAMRRHDERARGGAVPPAIDDASLERLDDIAASEDESSRSELGDDAPTRHPRILGAYELLRRIGGGGFGDVYEARRAGDGRRYAVKVLRRLGDDDPEAVARFRAEAEIAGRLRHDGIVEVLAAETAGDTVFLVMPLIDGVDAGRLVTSRPLACDEAVRLVRDAARACAHAHAAGVIHRDIKPSNILVERGSGRVLLTDFGLAKRLDARSQWTRRDARIGTVSSMPPEQANPGAFRSARLDRPDELGRRGDVYSLGATLYHLLARRPPFPVDEIRNDAATIREIETVRPRPPSRWNPSVPPGLDRICLKCLEKAPTDRYAGALELADDLQRVLDGRPVAARALGRGRRLMRWCRRRPAMAAGVLGLTLVVAALAGMWWLSAAEAARQTTLASDAAGREAMARTVEAAARQARLLEQYGADLRMAQQLWDGGDVPAMDRLLLRYDDWPRSAPTDAADLPDPRGFEWHHWRRRLAQPSAIQVQASPRGDFNRLSLSRDGARLAAVDAAGTLRAWSLDPAERAARFAAARQAAAGGPSDGAVELVAVEGDFATAEITDDGSTILALDPVEPGRSSTLTVIDLDGGFPRATIDLREPVSAIAIDASGLLFATGTLEGDVRIWSRETARPVGNLTRRAHAPTGERSTDVMHGAVTELDWSPDGLLVAAGCEDGFVAVWEVATGRVVSRIGQSHDGPVTGVSFSPDGGRLCSQGFGRAEAHLGSFVHGEVRVWETTSGQVVATLVPHEEKLTGGPFVRTARGTRRFGQMAPRFVGDGEHVVTTGDTMALVWRIADGTVVGRLQGHQGPVTALCGSADGRRIATGSPDHTLRVWDLTGERSCRTLGAAAYGGGTVSVGPDGRHVAAVVEPMIDVATDIRHESSYTRRTDRSVRVWRTDDGAIVGASPAREAYWWKSVVAPPCFVADGREVRWAGENVAVGSDPIDPTQHREDPRSSTDSIELASCAGSTRLVLRQQTPPNRPAGGRGRAPSYADEQWSSHRGAGGEPVMSRSGASLERLTVGSTEVLVDPHRSREITAVAIAPDGEQVALGTRDGGLLLRHRGATELELRAGAHLDAVTSLAYSADGAMLASGGFDRRVLLLGSDRHELLATLDGHGREIAGLCFSPDGRRLASAAGQAWRSSAVPGEVIMWDTATGKPCLTLRCDAPSAFGGVAFSPDGRRLYATANTMPTDPRTAPRGRVVVWSAEPVSAAGR